MTPEAINITPMMKRNRYSTWVLSATLLIVAAVMSVFPASIEPMIAAVVFMASLISGVIAWGKQRQPDFSFTLKRDYLAYHHTKGGWGLNWQSIQRVDQPKITHNLELITLPFIAIRLNESGYQDVLSSISPRLANHLLIQQRSLLLHSSDSCTTGTCYSEGLIENDTFDAGEGQTYTGIVAMFGNRMKRLHKELGYDLFIEIDQLDREPSNFVTLIQQCQQTVNTSLPESN